MDSKIFRYWGYTTNFFQSIFLIAVRLYWGFLFFYAGLSKFSDMGNVIPFFEQFGLPPIVAYLIATGELVCGILLFFGFLSRLAAICTTVIMVGAYVIAHPANFYSFFSYPPYFFTAPAFSFLMASLIVLFFGPGLFSIDAIIKCRMMKKSRASEVEPPKHEDHSGDAPSNDEHDNEEDDHSDKK
ncbi:MAG: hypothetical protein S4CHLAM6_14840 [Chlamydiae bacterium]|nr:hypothetical protein [Chlamydiota bacterium]